MKKFIEGLKNFSWELDFDITVWFIAVGFDFDAKDGVIALGPVHFQFGFN